MIMKMIDVPDGSEFILDGRRYLKFTRYSIKDEKGNIKQLHRSIVRRVDVYCIL